MKKVVKPILFVIILCFLVIRLNEIVLRKVDNRYFIMREEYKENGEEHYDVAIFGSCHAYRTVNSVLIEKETGMSSYNFSNPSEIMPSTYLNMYDKFQDFTPKIAFIETWGVHAYDTYIDQQTTLDGAFSLMIDSLPLSIEKMEIIRDFDKLTLLNENFALARYKNRLVNFDVSKEDYYYTYESMRNKNYDSISWLYQEIDRRIKNGGYSPVDATLSEVYVDHKVTVDSEEYLPVEEDIMKYVDKIIALCEEKDVIPIFFRAPYAANENELKKNHYLEKYLKEKGVLY